MKRSILFFAMMSSLLFGQWEPVEIYPVTGQIFGFHMSDSLNMTAALMDDSCYVIKSSDGGYNWTRTQRIPLIYMTDAEVIDNNNIFARTSSLNEMIFTSDGGVTWSSFNIPTRYTGLTKIQFLNHNTAFASVQYSSGSSTYTHLIKTVDNGVNWSISDSSLLFYQGFKFKDTLKGWILSNGIHQTTNGGDSFTEIPHPAEISFPTTIDQINDSIFMVGSSRWVQIDPWRGYYVPLMATSTNMGLTWLYKDLGDSNFAGIPNIVQFINPTTAIASLEVEDGLLYTTDIGVTWRFAREIGAYHEYKGINILENRIYLIADGIFFAVSGLDITNSWEIRTEQTNYNPLSASFLDPGYAIIGDEGGRLQVTTDRGNNWITRRMKGRSATKIKLVNDSLVYLANGNAFYKSDNLCRTIDSVSILQEGSIRDIWVQKNGTIWVASGYSILSSSNGGRDWVAKLTNTEDFFDHVIIFENGTGYASNVQLFKTTDNGTTWNQTGNYGFSILQICFLNSNFGLIRGSDSKVYRTRDGAVTLDQLNIPGMTIPSNIYLKDSLNIFVTANELYSTYDGGWSWKVNDFGSAPGNHNLKNMAMFDHFEGIGISVIGIWITHNRGNTPVEMSSFSAISLGNKVTLQWTTETETNNMGFEIERRFKNGDWTKVGYSKGHGTTTQKVYYTFDDLNPSQPGILYYRLKQIDYNGEFHYSKEVEVIYGETPENYSIQQNFPNPFNPSTKVTFSLPEENEVVIRVFNSMGEQVKEINRGILPHGYFEQEFEMGAESSGMYFCQVLCTNTISGRTKSLTIKMVLMK